MKICSSRLILVVCLLFTIGIFSIGCTTPSLTTESIPESGGTVTPPKGEYDKGVQVNVIASPNSGYRFDHWEGSTSGTAPNFRITMDGSKHLKAYFKKTYSLSASVSPGNGGTVSGGGTYDEGTIVTLVANPAQYYDFNSWSAISSGNSPQITVTMNSDKNVVANFTPKIFNLTTHVNPTEIGSVEPSDGTYQALSQVKITAVVPNGYRWDKWTGSETSTSNPLTITMNTDKNVTANFVKIYTLTLSSKPIEGGVINAKSGSYDAGIKIDLSVTPAFRYYPDYWTGTDNDNVFPTTVTMKGNISATANFAPCIIKGETKTVPHGVLASNNQIYADTASIPIQLNQYDWVRGQIIFDTTAGAQPTFLVRDPSGKTIYPDSGTIPQTIFTFFAQTTGPYTILIQNKAIWAAGYNLTYTIWGKP